MEKFVTDWDGRGKNKEMKTEQEIRDLIKKLDTDTEILMKKNLPIGETNYKIPDFVSNILKIETLFWVLGEKMPNTRKYNEGEWVNEKSWIQEKGTEE
jgi:hypothetical protein